MVHKLSSTKLQYLNLAYTAYEAAFASLPKPEELRHLISTNRDTHSPECETLNHSFSDDDEANFSRPSTPTPDLYSSPRSKSSQDIRPMSSYGYRPLSSQSYRSTSSQSNSTRPSAKFYRSPPSNTKDYKMHPRYSFINSPLSYKTTQRYSALRPSPLRIRKTISPGPGPSPMTPSPTTPSSTLPYPTPPSSAEDPFFPQSVSLQLSPKTKKYLHNQALGRYCTNLEDFAEMLENHIQGVDRLVLEAKDAQMQKSVSQRWGGSDGKPAERKAYIEKRRKEGWKMERFDAERVQRLCERALEEL